MMLHIRIKQTKRRKQARVGRHHYTPHAQRLCHARREQGTITTEGEQRVSARITASFTGYRANGPDHIRDCNLMGAIGGMGQI